MFVNNTVRKMRRVLVVVLTLSLLLSIGSFAASAKKVTLVAWAPWGPGVVRGETILNMMKKYVQKYPGIEVELVGLPWNEISRKLLISTIVGEAPDICYLDQESGMRFMKAGLFEPLLPEQAKDIKDNFYPSVQGSVTFNNIVYLVPEGMPVMVVSYNKRLFKEAAVGIPQTWDEIPEVAKKLTKRDQAGLLIQSGFSLWVQHATHVMNNWYLLYLSNGGSLMNKEKTKFIFDNEQGIRSLQFLVDLYQKDKVDELGFVTPFQGFVQGKRAMMAVPDYYGGIYPAKGMAEADIGAFAIPAGTEGRATFFIGNHVVGVPTMAKNKEQALDALKFLFSKENALVWVQPETGPIPGSLSPRIAQREDSIWNEHIKASAQLVDNAHLLLSDAGWTDAWSEINQAIGDQVMTAVLGKVSVEKALSIAEAVANKLLTEE